MTQALLSRRTPFWSLGLSSVLVTQFFSALADNAMLFVLLIYLKQALYAEWAPSALQAIFVIMYVIAAPFLGPLTEGFPKGRVMFYANAIKCLGAILLLIGCNPFIGYGLIGLGAAIYSPAKYGILGEIVPSHHLIKANSYVESSTIVAILLGSLLGGVIADYSLFAGLIVCLTAYFIAAISNLWVPKLQAIHPIHHWRSLAFFSGFFSDLRYLFQHRATRITLMGIFLFWSAAVLLRFLLISWIPFALGIDDAKTPAILNAIVGLGIIVGSLLAAKWIVLERSLQTLCVGSLMGLMIMVLMSQENMWFTALILFIAGAAGGWVVVPLNALLQSMGKHSIGAGHAIAIQNFGENSAMMCTLALYTIAVACHIPIITIGWVAGGVIALLMLLLGRISRKVTYSATPQ